MYKIYDANNNMLIVTLLAEVQELTGASDEQIRKMSLYRWNVKTINGFSVINYN